MLSELQRRGVAVTESQLQWALKAGKLTRPKLDGSLRFTFSEENISEIVRHFQSKDAVVSV